MLHLRRLILLFGITVLLLNLPIGQTGIINVAHAFSLDELLHSSTLHPVQDNNIFLPSPVPSWSIPRPEIQGFFSSLRNNLSSLVSPFLPGVSTQQPSVI